MATFSSNPTLTRVVFFDNFVLNYGGGLYNQDGSPSLTDVVFDANTHPRTLRARRRHAQHQERPADYTVAPVLTNVTFSNNESEQGGGGAMFNNTSDAILTNVTFTGNKAQRRGGALLNEGSSPVFNNVTFSGNTLTRLDNPDLYGQAMINIDAIFDGLAPIPSHPVLSNTIVWETGGDDIVNNPGSTVTINDSVLQDATCPSTGGGGTCTNVPSMPIRSWARWPPTAALPRPWRSAPGSSALDAGNNATCAADDQRGVTRPQGSDLRYRRLRVRFAPTVTGRSPAPGATAVCPGYERDRYLQRSHGPGHHHGRYLYPARRWRRERCACHGQLRQWGCHARPGQ